MKPQSAASPRVRKRLASNLVAYSLAAPGLIVFYLFVIYPLLQTVLFSFHDYQGLGSVLESEFVGLHNYAKAFADDKFGRAFAQTVYFSVLKTGSQIVISFLLAYFLYRKLAGWKIFQVALFMPAVVPLVVSAVLWRFFFEGNFGLLNVVLDGLHLGHWKHYWLSDPATAMNSVIVSAVWFSVPISMMILFSYMLRIPNEVIESAKIDGATTFHILIKIILPLMIPTVLFLLVYSVAEDFKAYEYILLFTNGGPVGRTEVAGLYAYKQAFELSDYGYSSALSLLILLFLTVLSLGLLSRMRKSVYEF